MENRARAKNSKANFWQWTAILFLVISSGVFFRLYPLTVTPERRRAALAQNALYQTLQQKIERQIEAAGPHLTETRKKQLAQKRLQAILREESQQFKQTAKQIAKDIPFDFHLLGADPFYFYYLTQNIKSSGNISEKIKDGMYYDPLMMAPGGHWRKLEAHPYVGFAFYKIISFFNPGIPLWGALAWTSVILFVPVILLFLYLAAFLKIDKISITAGSLFFSLSPIFLQRSLIGWYDTDIYNVFFPLLAICLLLKYAAENTKRKKYFYLSGLALTTGLYAIFWQGWILLFAFLTFYFLLTLIKNLTGRKKTSASSTLKPVLFYFFSALFFSALFLTPAGLKNSVQDISGIIWGFLSQDTAIWPDIFITVGEMGALTWRRFVHILGGYLFFAFFFSGAVILLFAGQLKINREQRLILLIYFFVTLFLGASARRFLLFFPPAAAISCLFFFFWLRQISKKWAEKFSLKKSLILKTMPPALILFSAISPFIYANTTAGSIEPVYNRVWEEALVEIKEKTPPDSIINTWWSPGHFIKAISRRRVSFDGATLNERPSYWLARFFLAKDEQLAIGILRMLNSSGTEATDFILAQNYTAAETVSFLEKILPLDKKEAKNLAKKRLGKEKGKTLIRLTHGQPPPSYLLVYDELAEGAVGLAYVKNWDFDKTGLIAKKRRQALRRGNIFWQGSQDQAAALWSVAGGMPYVSKKSRPQQIKQNKIYFENGVILNRENMRARIKNLENRISGIPKKVIYADQGELKKERQPRSNLNLAVLITQDHPGSYGSLVSGKEILSSILFRLYYLDGAGLHHFNKIIEKEDPRLNTRIIIYQVQF